MGHVFGDFIDFKSYKYAHYYYGFTKNHVDANGIHSVGGDRVLKSFDLPDVEAIVDCIAEYKLAKKMDTLGIGPRVYSLFQVDKKTGYILMEEYTHTLYDYVRANMDVVYENQLRKLIYKISRSGWLYIDMKPSNVIVNIRTDMTVDMRFIDFDSYFCKKHTGKYGAQIMMMLMFFSTIVASPGYKHPFTSEIMPEKKMFITELKKDFSNFLIIKEIIWCYFAQYVIKETNFKSSQLYKGKLLEIKKTLNKYNCVDAAVDMYYYVNETS